MQVLTKPTVPLSEKRLENTETLRLIRRAQAGEPAAFSDLVRRHYHQIYRWALVRAGDADDADDITQEVLVRLHEKLSQYRGQSQFTTWLYQVTRNTAAALFRSRQRRERSHDRAARERLIQHSTEADAVERLSAQEVPALLNKLLRELPQQQRVVFDLIELRETPMKEVTQMLGLKPATIRVHLLRARRALRSRILELHPELVPGR